MTIDEAIKQEKEIAKQYEHLVDRYQNHKDYGNPKSSITDCAKSCKICGEEHRQLAEWLEDYKRLLEQEPCDDVISREAVLNLCTNDKYNIPYEYEDDKGIHRGYDEYRLINYYKLKQLPSVTQKPIECDDAISRQAVLDIAKSSKSNWIDNSVLFKRVNELPPVTPQQKYGKWIAVYQGDEIINYRCSECELGDTNGSIYLYGWDYCRRCGARMVEPQESEE